MVKNLIYNFQMNHNFLDHRKKYHFHDKNFTTLDDMGSVTKKVTNFYSVAPFPNYNDYDDISSLTDKIEKNIFLKNLKKKIGFGKKIIEVGSGTSQLSLMLAHSTNNEVVALDPTYESLKLGHDFLKKNNIENCFFLNADLFEVSLQHEYFDYVWCSGVLHHTKNPKLGHKTITKWLKPNGIIIVGLYNKYGRFRTVFRQFVAKFFGLGIINFIDPYLKNNISTSKKNAWLRDQYLHPVESLHTIDEIMGWFKEENITFLNSIPTSNLESFKYESMFERTSPGNRLSRILAQIGMIFSPLGAEGGLFLVIGRKN